MNGGKITHTHTIYDVALRKENIMKSFNEWMEEKENEDRFKGYSWVDDLDQGSEKMGNLKPYSFERLSSGRFAGVNFKGEVFVSVDFFPSDYKPKEDKFKSIPCKKANKQQEKEYQDIRIMHGKSV